MNLPPGFWDGVLRRLGADVPTGVLNAWVRPMAVEADGDGVRLLCPTAFHRDRVRVHFLEAIERGVAQELGRDVPVALDLGPGLATRPEEDGPPRPAPLRRPPAARRPERPRQCELPYSFDSFVVGPCNALAREAALAVAHGRQSRANPLFIASAEGLGKTHLARATFAAARANGRERALYISAEGFTNAFTRSLRSRDTESFKRRFRRDCDLLVVEDVQFLKSKAATQLELFHTLCHLLDAGVRVVLTADRLPRDLDGLSPRLRSQMGAGLVAEVEAPDAAVRRRILRSKAAGGGVRIPDECLDLLVEKVRGSVRDLEGVLIQVVESAALLKRKVDLELTRAAIHKVAPQEPQRRRLEVDDVIGLVASVTGTKREAMCARSRRRDVLGPRQLAMYLCQRYTEASQSEIASAFGRRHPAVRNAVEVVERGILKRAPLRYQVEALAARLESLLERGEP